MRILLVTNLFDPEPNFLKDLAFAKELRRRGHDLHVLTGFPSYPGGRVYPGYRMRWTTREEMEGVPVTRVAMYPSHDASTLRRIASYVSVALSQAVHVLTMKERFDVCHAYLGPITLMWPAAVARWRWGARIVADVQDIWPESVTDSGMMRSRLLGRLLERWCRWAYRAADRLVVLSPGYGRAIAARGVDARRIDVVYNWCDERRVGADAAPAPSGILVPGAFNVVYAGNVGKLQGLGTVLDAAKQLARTDPRVKFALIGNGVELEKLRSRIASERIENVRMPGRLPADQAAAVQKEADLLLVHLEPTPLTRIGIPSKVQAYLASGAPVLLAGEGDAGDLVTRSGGGHACPPRDPAALAEAVRRFLAMAPEERGRMGAAGRAFYEGELCFHRGVDRIEKVLLAAVEERRAPSRSPGTSPSRWVKRALDFGVSLAALVVLAPALGAVALAIRARMGAPVFFVQERPGQGGRPFRLVKFRTMRDAVDRDGKALPDEARLTSLGRWLRATSVDEIPQLWNVLRGDLSLVGPRPLLMQYLPRYSREQARRHDVKPGITGWAQVNGRNAISWEQKFAHDVWYVDHWSLRLDLKILAMTAARVLKRSGISREGHATMPEFMGGGPADPARQKEGTP